MKKPITINVLQSMKQQHEKIAMLTSYDASFAALSNQCGVEIVLVGDTLGHVIQGHNSTIPVSIDAMIYHTECVTKGVSSGNKTESKEAFIIGDMPFMSYATPEQALENAAHLMQAGAKMVKVEGGTWLLETVSLLTERGIPVCAHLGLTPQSVHKLGGYKLQGNTPHTAEVILEDAIQLEKAGAQLLVLECTPATLAEEITGNVTIPTIGIGAGPYCDGQVMVIYDILGISTGKIPSFVKNFMDGKNSIQEAIIAYVDAVKAGEFPTVKSS